MAHNNFEKCLEIILHHEGGYVNHPKDPGGMTNLGVTKRAYQAWLGREVSEAEMRALTPETVKPFYNEEYWNRVNGDNLPQGLDLCVFDFGVNAGTSRAAKMLQRIIGTPADGGIGPGSLKALAEYMRTHTVEDLIEHYQHDRQAYYESLRNFKTFGRGWTRRVTETTETALSLT